MARPRTFEVDEALDAAIEAFWDHGYEATSMADLMEAMGLQKGSIYKVWDDKHALFVAALTRYLDRAHDALVTVIDEAGDPEAGLEALLSFFVGRCQEDHRGCFAVNTVVELSPHDSQAASILASHNKRIVSLLTRLLERAQDSGSVRRDRPALDLAHYLFVVLTGMITRSKGALPKIQVRRIAELSLEALR